MKKGELLLYDQRVRVHLHGCIQAKTNCIFPLKSTPVVAPVDVQVVTSIETKILCMYCIVVIFQFEWDIYPTVNTMVADGLAT